MAAQLSPHDTGLQLLENSIATTLALAVLILLFGPVSGAHFNPTVTAVDWWLHRGKGLSIGPAGAYILAQVTGGIAGAILANVMFGLSPVTWSTTKRTEAHLWLGEVVATAGLIVVIFALVRTHRTNLVPAGVGAYIGAAYWFSSSTSFANPAVTIGRAFTNTFAGIDPASVPRVHRRPVRRKCARPAHSHCALSAAKGRDRGHRRHRDHSPGALIAITTKPSILFICVHNAGRSQMAAGFLRHLAGDTIEARSAGSQPADQINPVAVEAMAEVGIDLTDQKPKILTPEDSEASSMVITMGCGDVCPYHPGQRHEDWELNDPRVRASTSSAPSATTSDAGSSTSSPRYGPAEAEEVIARRADRSLRHGSRDERRISIHIRHRLHAAMAATTVRT